VLAHAVAQGVLFGARPLILGGCHRGRARARGEGRAVRHAARVKAGTANAARGGAVDGLAGSPARNAYEKPLHF
jgi:hypothetical protein